MSKVKIYLLLLIGAFGWNSCLDEIEIAPAERPDSGYVIQGEIIAGEPVTAEVRVEELFFFTSNINRPVKDAQVRIVAEGGASVALNLNAVSSLYEATLDPADFPMPEGSRYRVEVSLSDGNEIVSEWDEIMPLVPKGDLSWRFVNIEVESDLGILTQRPGLAYSINSPLLTTAGTKAQLRWEFIDAYRITDDLDFVCYVENQHRASRVFVLDGTTVSSDTVQNYPLFSDQIGRKHIEGYYLTAYQQALSPESFKYWQEIQLLQEREGTVFDNPAGQVRTNLRNTVDSTRIVYGYFSAYQQDTLRLFLSREEMGNLTPHCPRPPTNQPFPPITICDGCIDAVGSSYNKPFYWEE